MAGMSPVAQTSCWVAANRALESRLPERLFEDPYAAALAGERGFAILAESQKVGPRGPSEGPDPYLSIRTRFFDDALLGASSDPTLRQVVILAAGMDARGFRLPWPEGTTLYELDRDEVFEHKEPILRDLGSVPRCERRVVRADLERDWIGPLRQAGFDEGRPSVFLAEGLAVYLDEESVARLLDDLARAARPGSWLGGDLVGTEMLASPQMRAFLEMVERLGCPWRFGTGDPGRLLSAAGWRATITQPGEPAANFGRWPYPVAPPGMPGIPRSYFAVARRAPSEDR